jgi:hypothetical protein
MPENKSGKSRQPLRDELFVPNMLDALLGRSPSQPRRFFMWPAVASKDSSQFAVALVPADLFPFPRFVRGCSHRRVGGGCEVFRSRSGCGGPEHCARGGL